MTATAPNLDQHEADQLDAAGRLISMAVDLDRITDELDRISAWHTDGRCDDVIGRTSLSARPFALADELTEASRDLLPFTRPTLRLVASRDDYADAERVIDDLRARIVADEWAPGEQLPTYREQMEHYQVGQQAVSLAVWYLRDDEGLLRTQRGRGGGTFRT
jgi:Bacterial regulatory proteins, gntR family